MRVSTRGRYALRVMTDLAERADGGYTPLKEVSARQGISLKYLEGIMAGLSKAGMVEGAHGKGGGYRLRQSPAQYRVGDILRLTEGSLAPVACLECGAQPCARAGDCRTLPMWASLDEAINALFDSYTLADLMAKPAKEEPPCP